MDVKPGTLRAPSTSSAPVSRLCANTLPEALYTSFCPALSTGTAAPGTTRVSSSPSKKASRSARLSDTVTCSCRRKARQSLFLIRCRAAHKKRSTPCSRSAVLSQVSTGQNRTFCSINGFGSILPLRHPQIKQRASFPSLPFLSKGRRTPQLRRFIPFPLILKIQFHYSKPLSKNPRFLYVFSGFFLSPFCCAFFLGFSSKSTMVFQICGAAPSPEDEAFRTRRLFVINAMLLSFYLEMHGYLYEF